MAMVPVDTWALGCLILIWTWNILFVSFYGLSMKKVGGGGEGVWGKSRGADRKRGGEPGKALGSGKRLSCIVIIS